VSDQFQFTTIIAKAIRDSVIVGEGSRITTEQATCVAKAVVGALTEAGLTIGPVLRCAEHS
jgi:hypothetical protein